MNDPVRIRFRGSNASASIIERIVNATDAVPDRAGGRYAKAEAEFDVVASVAGVPINTSAWCVVDAYDGRHHLQTDDALVSTDDGWEVRHPAAAPTLSKEGR